MNFLLNRRELSFAWMLPVLSITYWTFTVIAPVTISLLRMRHLMHASGFPRIRMGQFEIGSRFTDVLKVVYEHVSYSAEAPITVLSSGHDGRWQPGSLLPWEWICLVYPVFALPAWYFVGCGLDAAFRQRRVRTTSGVTAILFTLILAVLAGGLQFGMTEAERQGPANLFIAGFALWACLFAIPATAWLRERFWRQAVSSPVAGKPSDDVHPKTLADIYKQAQIERRKR